MPKPAAPGFSEHVGCQQRSSHVSRTSLRVMCSLSARIFPLARHTGGLFAAIAGALTHGINILSFTSKREDTGCSRFVQGGVNAGDPITRSASREFIGNENHTIAFRRYNVAGAVARRLRPKSSQPPQDGGRRSPGRRIHGTPTRRSGARFLQSEPLTARSVLPIASTARARISNRLARWRLREPCAFFYVKRTDAVKKLAEGDLPYVYRQSAVRWTSGRFSNRM